MTDFATSFDSLDADFSAGFGEPEEFAWDSFPVNNNGATSTSTVSPKDLMNEFMGSNPPSTAFTNLTSPDINGSPYGATSTDVSPMFTNIDNLGQDTSNWFSLFPDETGSTPAAVAPPMQRNDSNISTGQDSSATDSPLVLDQHNFRRKSSNAASPGHARHSSVTGVGKQRRKKQPLPSIVVDGNDKVAVKRARNTLAARESRQRKLDHLSTLEARIKELEDREVEFKTALSQCGYNGPLMHS